MDAFVSMIFSTRATVGALRFNTFDREIMYLCSVSYSLAEIVYRRALRRIGSAVDFAETRPSEEGGGDIVRVLHLRGAYQVRWCLLMLFALF